jgi:hypothetical protein
MSDHHFAHKRYTRSLELLERALRVDNLQEDLHCQTLRVYAALGDRAGLMGQYQEMRRVLAKELDLEPLEGTTRLYLSLMDRLGKLIVWKTRFAWVAGFQLPKVKSDPMAGGAERHAAIKLRHRCLPGVDLQPPSSWGGRLLEKRIAPPECGHLRIEVALGGKEMMAVRLKQECGSAFCKLPGRPRSASSGQAG